MCGNTTLPIDCASFPTNGEREKSANDKWRLAQQRRRRNILSINERAIVLQ
jgi:hypothetical protein